MMAIFLWGMVLRANAFQAAAALVGAPAQVETSKAVQKIAIPVKPETIPLYMSEKRMMVMLRVGNSQPLPVVFDTGTNGNLVSLNVADQLHLPKNGPSPSVDGSTGKPVPGYDTFLKNASIGGLAIQDARATAFPYDVPDEAGVIGPNSFPNKLVRVEGARSRLVLLPKTVETIPHCKAFPYEADALPSAILEIGALKLSATLDTGNSSSILLPMEYIQKLSLDAPPVQIGYAVSAAGKQPIFSAHLKGTVKIGSVTLDQPEIRFIAGGTPNVGLPILRQLTVVIDPTEGRDWVLSADPKQDDCAAGTGDAKR
jgi:predicted aspartyl protease